MSPSSPGLNPIEKLWALLRREIYREGRQNSSTKSIWMAAAAAAKKKLLYPCFGLQTRIGIKTGQQARTGIKIRVRTGLQARTELWTGIQARTRTGIQTGPPARTGLQVRVQNLAVTGVLTIALT